MTLERLEASHLSGPLYFALKRRLSASPAPTAASAASAADTPSPFAFPFASRSRRLVVGPLLSAETATDVSDSNGWYLANNQDAEPTVTALNGTYGTSSPTYTVTAAMTYDPDWHSASIYAHSSSSTPPGSFAHSWLPIPLDGFGNRLYDNAGDPVLAANVYDGGIAPKRIYCVGNLFRVAQDAAPSAIALWHSDDGGQTWSQPTMVTQENGGGLLADKPTVAVSYYNGTLGHVYVAWAVRDSNNPNTSHLSVAWSTNGGATFETPFIISWDNVNDSSIAVDANTGTVYAVWLNFRTSDIRVAQSSGTSGSLAFGTHSIVSSGNFAATLYNGLRSPTVPLARFNWVSARLMVMWHMIDPVGGLYAKTYYSYYPCSVDCNGYAWKNKVVIPQATTFDQFQPAFDYTSSGDVMASFYSSHEDTQGQKYYAYVTTFHSDGSRIPGVDDLRVSWAGGDASNPTYVNTFM